MKLKTRERIVLRIAENGGFTAELSEGPLMESRFIGAFTTPQDMLDALRIMLCEAPAEAPAPETAGEA